MVWQSTWNIAFDDSEPTGKYDYAEIMGAMKRNFARDYNDLMAGRCGIEG
ncbi:MAG: hypothetical protein K6U80_03745 [Firmicutes bacterium]|nr:hypothetical protein [Bacillota bacterium]